MKASPVRTNQGCSFLRAGYKEGVGRYCGHFVEAQRQAEDWGMNDRAGGKHGGRRSL